ncbi:hypothetical protein Bbelb_268640 [Branchiostoma belcheri]|nr:hypothetical protein Bbelb_268640 [Branchiostoma belcheri]
MASPGRLSHIHTQYKTSHTTASGRGNIPGTHTSTRNTPYSVRSRDSILGQAECVPGTGHCFFRIAIILVVVVRNSQRTLSPPEASDARQPHRIPYFLYQRNGKIRAISSLVAAKFCRNNPASELVAADPGTGMERAYPSLATRRDVWIVGSRVRARFPPLFRWRRSRATNDTGSHKGLFQSISGG